VWQPNTLYIVLATNKNDETLVVKKFFLLKLRNSGGEEIFSVEVANIRN